MKTERDRLARDLEQRTADNGILASNEQMLAQENSRLKEELSSSRDVSQKLVTQMQTTHEAVLLSLEAQRKKLQEELETREKTIDAIQKENSALTSKLDSLERDQNSREDLLKTDEKQEAEAKLQKLTAEVERLRAFETQIADLQRSAQEVAAEKERLLTELHTSQQFQSKISESRQQLMEEVIGLRQAVADLVSGNQVLQTQVARNEDDTSTLQAEITRLNELAEKRKEDLDTATSNLLTADLLVAETRATVNQLTSEKLQLQEAVGNLQQQVLQTLDTLQQAFEQYKLKGDEQEAQLAQTKALVREKELLLETLEAEAQTSKQQAAQTAAELQESLRQTDLTLKDCAALRSSLQEATKKTAELEVQVDKKAAEISAVQSQLAKSQEENTTLSRDLEAANTNFEQSKKTQAHLEETLNEKNNEIDDIRNRFGLKETEVKETGDQLKKLKVQLKLIELKEEKEKLASQAASTAEKEALQDLKKENEQLLERLNQCIPEIATLTAQRQLLEDELNSALERAERERSLHEEDRLRLASTIESLREAQIALQQQAADDKEAIEQLTREKRELAQRESDHQQQLSDLSGQVDGMVVARKLDLSKSLKQEEGQPSDLQEDPIAESAPSADNPDPVQAQLQETVDSLRSQLLHKTALVCGLAARLGAVQQTVSALRSEVEGSKLSLTQLKEKTLFETPEFISLFTQQFEQKVALKARLKVISSGQSSLLLQKEKTKDGILEELHQSLNFDQLLSKFEEMAARDPGLSSNQLLIHNLNQNPHQPSGIRVDNELHPEPTTGTNEKEQPLANTTNKKKKPKEKSVTTAKRISSKRSKLGAFEEQRRPEAGREEAADRDQSTSKTLNPDREYLGKRKSSDIKKRLEADFMDLQKKGAAKPIRDDGLRNLTNLTGGEIEPIVLKSERKRPAEVPEAVGRFVHEPSASQKHEGPSTPDNVHRKKKSQ